MCGEGEICDVLELQIVAYVYIVWPFFISGLMEGLMEGVRRKVVGNPIYTLW